MHYFTQARHYAFSDYARDLQRKARHQDKSDANRSAHKRSYEPER